MDIDELQEQLHLLVHIYELDDSESSICMGGDLLKSYMQIVSEEKKTACELKEHVNQLFSI